MMMMIAVAIMLVVVAVVKSLILATSLQEYQTLKIDFLVIRKYQ